MRPQLEPVPKDIAVHFWSVIRTVEARGARTRANAVANDVICDRFCARLERLVKKARKR